MASTTRGTAASVKDDLLQRGHRYSFCQAVRLLRLLLQEDGEGRGARQQIRMRPALTLAFPSADVTAIEETADGYLLEAAFLGLYGPASPLPTFYTEDLVEETTTEKTVCRDFVDILNQRLFDLFLQTSMKYRLFLQIVQEERKEYLERLFCLAGMAEEIERPDIPAAAGLLRYVGLLGTRTRSALGLATFLTDVLQVPVKVLQCQETQVAIPQRQLLSLGSSNCSLDVDAIIGREVTDRSAQFRLQIGPLDRSKFDIFLPERQGRAHLEAMVAVFLASPLVWDVELVHRKEDVPAATLGTVAGGRLGWDSWIAPGALSSDPSVVFPN